MLVVDTHSHIFDDKFSVDIEDVISRSKLAGVSYILLPNINIESISQVNGLSKKYPKYCLPMMGLHPTSITNDWEKDLIEIKKQFQLNNYIAVGEIGVDLYWDISFKEQQLAAFEEQLKWSIEFNLPVSIHCRNAIMEAIECIKNVGQNSLRGVFHSFSGTKHELDEIMLLGNFLIGINGTVTYKNSILPEVLKGADLSKIVIETDAPYLPPMPYRGKRNEPAYTVYILDKLSEIYRLSPAEIANQTTENAKIMFGLN